MKWLFIIMLLLVNIDPVYSQNDTLITQTGWLIYHNPGAIGFFPTKNPNVIPGYNNFLCDSKDVGLRLNNIHEAPGKLLLAKIKKFRVYNYDTVSKGYRKDGKWKFYVQPVKVSYRISKSDPDTGDYCADGWVFKSKNKHIVYSVYYFMNRNDVSVHLLSVADSAHLKRGGRRSNISIYPPH